MKTEIDLDSEISRLTKKWEFST